MAPYVVAAGLLESPPTVSIPFSPADAVVDVDTPSPHRLGAALLGLVLFAVLLGWNPSLPDPIAFGAASIPLGLCWYGVSSQSPVSAVLRVGALAVALTLASCIRGAGPL
ncbi:hypothetical protein [Halolamina sediminis]|jgi:hypothetical protein|uniref:hypothetical protein n=1 Tax=Halolamina sediminis TaxID=1480675 RepID=UPI0006B5D30D|nr:hypothetical protein [Halolamina sediminis]